MSRYDGFKFSRRFPQVGETYLTYQGSNDKHVNFATVIELELWDSGGGSITFVYYDHNRDELVQGIQRGALDPKSFKVINV